MVFNALTILCAVFFGVVASSPTVNAAGYTISDLGSVVSNPELSFSTKSCGDFFALESATDEHERAHLDDSRVNRARVPESAEILTVQRDYQNSRFFLSFSGKKPGSIRGFKSAIDQYFYSELSRRAVVKLNQEISSLLAFEAIDRQNEIFAAIEPLIRADSKHPRQNSLALLSLFPSLRYEIHANQADPLGPLLCRLEQRQYKLKMFKKWSNYLVIPAVCLGVATIATVSAGIALPPLAIAAGVSACALGFRDFGLSIQSLNDKERAGAVAKKLINAYECLESGHKLSTLRGEREGFNKSEMNQYLRGKEAILGQFAHRKIELKDTIRSRDVNRLLMVAAILNIGFNSFNLTGDPRLLVNLVSDVVGF